MSWRCLQYCSTISYTFSNCEFSSSFVPRRKVANNNDLFTSAKVLESGKQILLDLLVEGMWVLALSTLKVKKYRYLYQLCVLWSGYHVVWKCGKLNVLFNVFRGTCGIVYIHGLTSIHSTESNNREIHKIHLCLFSFTFALFFLFDRKKRTFYSEFWFAI